MVALGRLNAVISSGNCAWHTQHMFNKCQLLTLLLRHVLLKSRNKIGQPGKFLGAMQKSHYKATHRLSLCGKSQNPHRHTAAEHASRSHTETRKRCFLGLRATSTTFVVYLLLGRSLRGSVSVAWVFQIRCLLLSPKPHPSLPFISHLRGDSLSPFSCLGIVRMSFSTVTLQ